MKNRQISRSWMLLGILILLLSLAACEMPAPIDPPPPTQDINSGGSSGGSATNTPTPGAADQTAVPGSETPVPGSETPVPGSETAVPGSETVVPGSETAVPGSETAVPGSETPVGQTPAPVENPTNTPTPAAPPNNGSGGTPTTHVVQPGETVYRLSVQYGVSVDAIAAANGLGPHYTIYVGQTLVIPGSDGSLPPTVQPPPGSGGCSTTHIVQAGENLFRIGLRYGYTVDQLAAANPEIVNPNNIKVGQVICIP